MLSIQLEEYIKESKGSGLKATVTAKNGLLKQQNADLQTFHPLLRH